jgi:hypothetical protein
MVLKLIATEGPWLVFNQAALRQEVAQYLWGPDFVPFITELYSRTNDARVQGGLTIQLPDDHWALSRTAFAARPNLIERIRPEVRLLMERVPRRPALPWVHTPPRTLPR